MSEWEIHQHKLKSTIIELTTERDALKARVEELERIWYEHRCEHSPTFLQQAARICALKEAAREVPKKQRKAIADLLKGNNDDTLWRKGFRTGIAAALTVLDGK